MDRTLWSITSSKPAVLLKIQLCEKKRKHSLVRFYQFSTMFLCEQQEEERWKEADTYTESIQFWLRDVTYHSFDTHQNRRCRIENHFSRHVRLKTYHRWSHKIQSPKLIFKNCKIKAYFGAYVYYLLSFKAV